MSNTENKIHESAPSGNGHRTAEVVAAPAPHVSTAPVAATPPPRRRRKRWIMLAVLAVIAVSAAFWAVPEIQFAFHHVSTDDAMVNTHITYVSPRIPGTVQEVLVDDNQYVEKGTPLVVLDPSMLRLAVDQKAASLNQAKIVVARQVASLDIANADLEQARTQVRGQLAGLRAAWYLVATVEDFVRYETATLESNDSNVRQQRASLQLAQEEYDRVTHLSKQTISQEEIDQRHTALLVAQEQVNSAEQSVQQTRALLGIRQKAGEPTTIPSDLAQTFNGTQYAAAMFKQSLTQLGLPVDEASNRLAEMKDRAMALGEEVAVERSPTVAVAKTQVELARATLGGDAFDRNHPETQPSVVQAQKELDEAKLRLSYARIEAPISGYITRRNVNPGAHLQEGQDLMAIRPLNDVWIDANFKETQISDIRIGQAVEMHVDAYPSRVFHGRVAGFSPGTGAMMSILPPENATGNFVKVVQRLPIRIELTEENPKDTPLFAGLSVVPDVDIVAQPTGPDAGQRLLTATKPPASPATRAVASRNIAGPSGDDGR